MMPSHFLLVGHFLRTEPQLTVHFLQCEQRRINKFLETRKLMKNSTQHLLTRYAFISSFSNAFPQCTVAVQIYGEDEKIYGYQDLVIDVRYTLIDTNPERLTYLRQLRFASGSLAQYLSVRYAEKLDASTTVDNVEGTLKEFIPPGTFHFPYQLLFHSL